MYIERSSPAPSHQTKDSTDHTHLAVGAGVVAGGVTAALVRYSSTFKEEEVNNADEKTPLNQEKKKKTIENKNDEQRSCFIM